MKTFYEMREANDPPIVKLNMGAAKDSIKDAIK